MFYFNGIKNPGLYILIILLAGCAQSKIKSFVVNEKNFIFAPCVEFTCHHKTLCKDVQAYPELQITLLMKNLSPQHEVSKYFNTSRQNTGALEQLGIHPLVELHNTSIPLIDCSTEIKPINPRAAYSEQKGWLFVVNHPPYNQVVKMELCERTGSCSTGFPEIDSNYISTCTQFYGTTELATIDRKGRAFMSKVEYPAGCFCSQVKAVGPHKVNRLKCML